MHINKILFRFFNDKHAIIKEYLKTASKIIEIGSHLGTDTAMFRKNFPNADIICFEPDPRSREIFEKYQSHLGTKLFPFALSNKNEEVEFYQAFSKEKEEHTLKKYSWIKPEDIKNNKLSRCGASSLKKGHNAVANAEKIKIKSVKLDDWANENKIDKIDLIWMDVQGAEKDVIEGAENILKQTKYIWTEFGELDYNGAMDWSETKNILKNNFKLINYESYFLKRGDMFFVNKNLKNL